MVSTLDVLPTVLSINGKEIPSGSEVDGIDVTDIFFGRAESSSSSQSLLNGDEYQDETRRTTTTMKSSERAIFFWRDGFKTGPMPAPFGRFDVVAMKIGWYKLWFWTKSSHYNADEEVYHDPPLIFDVLNDPAEASPLDSDKHADLISRAMHLVSEHKASVEWTTPLTLARDAKYLPCVNVESGCRTSLPPLDGCSSSIEQTEEWSDCFRIVSDSYLLMVCVQEMDMSN